MDDVAFVSNLADFLIGLGAPSGLPEDWIILADHDDLRWIKPKSKAKRYLRLAKLEALQKHLQEIIGPDAEACDAAEDESDHITFGELKGSQRDECIRKEIDNLAELVEHLRYHGSRNDCFGRDVRRECGRIGRQIWSASHSPKRPAQKRVHSGLISGDVVYIISIGNRSLVKIGFTKNLNQRLRSLHTASPHDVTIRLVIPGSRLLERKLHERFEFARQSPAREWFRLTAEIKSFIEAEKTKQRGS